MIRRVFLVLGCLIVCSAVFASSSFGAFGVSEFGLSFDGEGRLATQAGSHPFSVTNLLQINRKTGPEGETPDGQLRDIEVELPPGVVGDPTAVPQCSSENFIDIDPRTKIPDCSEASVVGAVSVNILKVAASRERPNFTSASLYNLETPPGVVQELGFSAFGVPVTIEFRLSQVAPYNVIATLHYIAQPLPVFGSELVVWGDPASPVHDEQRGECINVALLTTPGIHTTGASCPSSAPERAYVTLPRSCEASLSASYTADSWEAPGAWIGGAIPSVPSTFTECSTLNFAPTIEARPTEAAAASGTGLNFDLDVDDPGLTEVSGRADSDIEKVVVTLPKGITTNPAVAAGLGVCALAQYEAAKLGEPACPEASKIGSVEVESPLLEKDADEGPGLKILHGSIYVAKQGDNPFHNLLTIYLMIEDPQLGIFVKLPGRVQPDSASGQITTTFGEPGYELPQLPFSHFHLHFREGRRAPLITPAVCGSYSATADLYPYAAGVPAAHDQATFQVTAGANGAPCTSSEAALPNHPGFSAGTVSPQAGGYSPFILKLEREDGSQELSTISTTLPEGLLGKLDGISYCPQSSIDQALSRNSEGDGALEQSSPSCPAASEVGTVVVGAGAGSEPLYVAGHAYLAGPYRGAPLSLEIITPAIAGPFDLGVVAVRTALQVDPLTAQITATSDPIPGILHGLPLDVRSIALDMDRPDFTLNPTSCAPKSITGSATSSLGSTAALSQYFQVSNCAPLAFKPKLAISLKGGTKRAAHPALKATLTYPKGGGYANIARARVSLPHSEFLDQSNLSKVCTQGDLKAGTCPAKSIYGKVKAWTPLLEKPLEGNVYLGVGFGYKLPALVGELNGQIRVLLKGKVDTDKQHGIRNTFEAVPDAPVEKFVLELRGGPKYGLLENSENICKRKQMATASFTAQNGRTLKALVKLRNGCPTAHGRKTKR